MTQNYTTKTGYYVLVDTDGVVQSKANVPEGTHPVGDNVDLPASFDVESGDALDRYAVGDPATE